MALLLEAQRIDVGEKSRIQVDVHEVVVVFAVLGREGIHGPIRRREGIHEGGQAAFEHGEKGVAHRKAGRPAKDRMFKNVGHAGGVFGDGLEGHAEGVLPIGIADVDVPGAGFFMGQLIKPGLNIGKPGDLVDGVATEPASCVDAGIVDICFGFHESLQCRLGGKGGWVGTIMRWLCSCRG